MNTIASIRVWARDLSRAELAAPKLPAGAIIDIGAHTYDPATDTVLEAVSGERILCPDCMRPSAQEGVAYYPDGVHFNNLTAREVKQAERWVRRTYGRYWRVWAVLAWVRRLWRRLFP